MNNGLPSLLDAIFGKQDLASVSVDEMYEVINEFPSFNAAHFLLAKKLKEQNDAAYDHESKRTALYFNNAFWLQTLLNEENHNRPVGSDRTLSQIEDELDEETEEILDEEYESGPASFGSGNQDQHPPVGMVSSFDELISKYKIDTEEVIYETPPEIQAETGSANGADSGTDVIDESVSGPSPETKNEFPENLVAEAKGDFWENEELKPDEIHGTIVVEEEFHEPVMDEKEFYESEVVEEAFHKPVEDVKEFHEPVVNEKEIHEPVADEEEFEIREEILNDYGIFEEVVVKKTDHDLEAFDRPIEQVPDLPETVLTQTEAVPVSTETAPPSAEIAPPSAETFLRDTEEADNSTIVENQVREDSPDKTDEQDYNSFDRPLEEVEPEQIPSDSATEAEFSEAAGTADADNTEKTTIQYAVPEEDRLGIEMQGLADRIDEHRKAVAVFDSKNAESIVFAPYHMIDYFASQGIKLVLEENPADSLGRQLKSFTDWLKFMKKLPAQPETEKADEKEADRIRHFAAHSIEERDILTESMAEVLAKQGMYENAIALYQKLSLIYPPKSAYFASRIEQLKASLP